MINKYKLMNPDYTHYLYDDNDMDNFVNKYFNGEIAECYNKLNIIVAKLIFFQYWNPYLNMEVYI